MMTVALMASTVLSLLVALIWATRHVTINRFDRAEPPLRPSDPGAGPRSGRVSVLVAAKDEEKNIAGCVQSLLAQDYPELELIVIDDRSSDATGDAARRAAAGDPRLRLLRIDELPAGWCGKNHALWRGVEQASGEWLCTVDADCRQSSPRTISVAVAFALRHRAQLLSILPVLRMEGFWENVIQPVCGALMAYRFRPDHVNDARMPVAYANGAFMLFRREAYAAVGGHEAVKNCILDDLRLAERIKSSGHRLRVAICEGLYEVRMYTSVREMIAGWTRIFWGALRPRRRLLLASGALLIMGMFPYFAFGGAVLAGAAEARGWLAAAVASGLAIVLQLSVVWRVFQRAGGQALLCWTWPIGCAFTMLILLRAWRLHARGASLVWRNTAYPTADRG
jgi:glycosyltransferase involved in cell wall biosynthesis